MQSLKNSFEVSVLRKQTNQHRFKFEFMFRGNTLLLNEDVEKMLSENSMLWNNRNFEVKYVRYLLNDMYKCCIMDLMYLVRVFTSKYINQFHVFYEKEFIPDCLEGKVKDLNSHYLFDWYFDYTHKKFSLNMVSNLKDVMRLTFEYLMKEKGIEDCPITLEFTEYHFVHRKIILCTKLANKN